jgi:hypothetical protein
MLALILLNFNDVLYINLFCFGEVGKRRADACKERDECGMMGRVLLSLTTYIHVHDTFILKPSPDPPHPAGPRLSMGEKEAP